ncbi:MAG: sulfurtransferase TusA family protein [Candidatus Margulisbacteria bacterium]|nr:sulfurtransferase TusA family protein [Candidatus Margulisiibacteriota bacterium]
MKADETLDCFGLLCPMPIVKTAEKIKAMRVGQVLEVDATDVGIKSDMPAWCKATGQEYLGIEEKAAEYKVYVKKVRQ